MLQWFLRFSEFPEFTEFNESSTPFRENSTEAWIGVKLEIVSVNHFFISSWRRGSMLVVAFSHKRY